LGIPRATKLLVLIAKKLKSKLNEKDYHNSTKTKGRVIKKIRIEIKASLQSQVDEREVDLEHNIQHVKEKGEGSSLEIRFKKCEQFQNLVE